jgi:hypothetical protein
MAGRHRNNSAPITGANPLRDTRIIVHLTL